MPLAGNPKKLALDVAHGFQNFTPANLRQYTAEDLKNLLLNLEIVLREVRGKQIPLDNIEALKEKNMRVRRLTQAVFTIKSYASSKGNKL